MSCRVSKKQLGKFSLTVHKIRFSLTLETIKADITNIDKRVKTLETQLKNKDDAFAIETSTFLQVYQESETKPNF